MNRLVGLLFFGPLLASISVVSAQGGQTCNITNLCPESAPCCSSFGFCGTDSFCLSGCNPLYSNTLDSCKPDPVCESTTYSFADNSRINLNATDYDGNATAYDWVVNTGNISNTNENGGELVMILTEDNGGTRLSSTRYVHYGTITTRLKTGRWAGVVTAFITMSDVKDEIDWEFPGANTTTGQTNFFWQGNIPTDTHGDTTTGLTDTYSDYHDYTVDWQPDTLTFMVDNQTVRTINRSDYEQDGISQFPDTPSSIQLSLWPAGINTSAEGTIEWAGGMIDWTDPDYVSAGHFYALVSSVTVQCNDQSPSNPDSNVTSYVYGSNTTSMTPSVSFSNKSILLSGASILSVEDMSRRVWWAAGAVALGLVALF